MSSYARPPLEETRPFPPEVSCRALALRRRLLSPIEAFLRIEAASGVVVLAMAILALVIANSPWGARYEAVLDAPVGLVVGSFDGTEPVRFWVNEALMTIFFFVVGLEIRRETHDGELSSTRVAALPLAAAVGGMIVPALVYVAFTAGNAADMRGWGVPMATDIAFALSVLTLLGRRVPPALRVLLLAVAIVDDIGSVIVIAFFYSGPLHGDGFVLAFAGIGGVFLLQRLGSRRAAAYLIPGVAVWLGALRAGVHPAIAGVALGLLTPVRAWLGPDGLVEATRATVDRVSGEMGAAGRTNLDAVSLARETQHLERVRREALAPVKRLEFILHPWVAFGVMPLFALVNAGVSVHLATSGASGASLGLGRLSLGVFLGLLVGKPAGIIASSVLLARLGVVALPRGIGRRHLVVLGMLGGIGFTMAIFIAALAFPEGEKLEEAKAALLVASFVAACAALVVGRWLLPKRPVPAPAPAPG